MAVSIMSPCCRASLVSLALLVFFLQVFIEGEVLRRPPPAHSMFLRSKRANMFLVEEIMQGNLERECYEEMCNQEEAREYFEDDEKTKAFWTVYYDGDQCQPNPCLHGGNCTDEVGGFTCSCAPPHHGPACELGTLKYELLPPPTLTITAEIFECPTEGPTACHQLCTASRHSFTCSCMSGFKLQSDKRSCLPEVEFPCGRLPDKFNTTTLPWQVSLLDRRGVELCGGVVLGRRSVLTATRCLLGSDLQPSNFYVLAGNKKLLFRVRFLYINNRFHRDQHDNDLALLELAKSLPFGPTLVHLCLPAKDFSENILMHAGRTGIAERRDQNQNQNQNLVYMTLDECRSQLNVSHPLSNKMFCMTSQNGAEGRQSGAEGSQNGAEGRQNGAEGSQNGAEGSQNGAEGRQNGAEGSQNEVDGRQNGAEGSQNGAVGNKNESQGSLNGPLRNQHVTHRRLNEHKMNQNQNQTHKSQNGADGTPNGAENRRSFKIETHKLSESDGTSRSEVSRRRYEGLLPGSPVATVEKETAYLTGLLISSAAGCRGGGGGGGMVFTKLSRYLVWIKRRLEAVEGYMTPQVSVYPEKR